jgi:multiple sugar transport system permease protein
MNKKIKIFAVNACLAGAALIMIFPMIWMIIFSLKNYPESYKSIWSLLAAPFVLTNYTDALSSDAFLRYFVNSFFIASVVTLGNVFFCLFCAYALARKEFFGKNVLFLTIAGVMIIPPHVIMIPLYRLMVGLDWINQYYALIFPWLVTPFGVFLVKQYLESLPKDIEEAARIDGAGNWRVLFKIVFPLCKPILTVLAIYTFLGNWNSFLFPFLFTNSEDMRTLPVGLTFYLGKQSIDWGRLTAGAGISALPVIGMFLLFQKQIINGLTSGALKE